MNNPYRANNQPNPFPSHATLSSNDPNLLTELARFSFRERQLVRRSHLRVPYIYQYNLSIQRQLVQDLVLDVSYVGSDSHKLTNMEDGNPIILGTTTRVLNDPRYPYFTSAGATTDNGFAALPETITNDGSANYNGLLTSLTKRFSNTKGIGSTFMTLAYTWSHNIDNGSGSITSTSGNIPYYNHDALVGNSAYDQRQRLTIAGGWELPFDKAWSSGPKRLTTGWTLYPIFSDYTGTPFSISAALKENSPVENKAGASGAGDNQLVQAELTVPSVQTFNPHTTQTIVVGTTSRTGLYYFNPNDFTVPSTWNSASYIPTAAERTYGMGRNTIPGIGVVNLDLALAKRIRLFGTLERGVPGGGIRRGESYRVR